MSLCASWAFRPIIRFASKHEQHSTSLVWPIFINCTTLTSWQAVQRRSRHGENFGSPCSMSMIGKATILYLLSSCGCIRRVSGTAVVDVAPRLLPDWLPLHPHRWWIHTRTVFVPMTYLYGVRFKAEENDLILALREVSWRRWL
jgi:hypothetical protein